MIYPVDGTLTSSPLDNPPHHHFWGNFAVDDAAGAGAPVYARFANSTGTLSLTLGGTFEPCASAGSGGSGVIVNVLIDGQQVGRVHYAHLTGIAKSSGPISNGDQVGTLYSGPNTPCWMGAHTHVEPRGLDGSGCFVSRAHNGDVNGSTPLGVIGGGYTTGDNQTCPAGAENGPPVAKPSCGPVSAVVPAGTATPIQLTCTGDGISYAAPSAPAHGTISGFDAASGKLTYTPAAGYTGPDSFTFTASNAGGSSDPATASITVSAPPVSAPPVSAPPVSAPPVTVPAAPVISNLQARSLCVRSARLRSTPTHGTHGLAFSYTLNQSSEVHYVLYRRNGGPHRRRCPQKPSGHAHNSTFTQEGILSGSGSQGDNSIVLSTAAPRHRKAAVHPRLRHPLRAGRHRVRLAQITKGRVLTAGTYILLVVATDALGQHSNLPHVKFFVLSHHRHHAART